MGRENQRRTGRALLYRGAKRIVSSLPPWLIRFRPFGIYEIQLSKPPDQASSNPLPPRRLRDSVPCDIRWFAGSDDKASLRPFTSQENIAAMDSPTRRSVAAWLDGQVIACAWIATESFEERELGIRFQMHENEVWLFAAVVEPQCRNQGVYGQLLQFVIAELARAKVERILFGVTLGNEPSRRAHARHGARRVGAIFALRSVGVTMCCGRGAVRLPSLIRIGWRTPIDAAITQ